MDFRILGPLEITDGDRVISLAAAQRSLLALLLLSANQRPMTRQPWASWRQVRP
jgi:DNA-binding SARP family transcriptional activator